MNDPLRWSDDDLDRLATYDERDVDEALAWWSAVVPSALALLLVRPDGEQRFTYDVATGLYTDTRTGRTLTEEQVRAQLDTALRSASDDARTLSDNLRDGVIVLAAWQLAMLLMVKRTQYVASALAVGGVAMQAALSPVVGATDKLRTQLVFLRNFADEIATGKQRVDGVVGRRAALYGQAAREGYESSRVEVKRVLLNHDEERNVLGIADHCEECLSETDRGWVPIGSLVPVGQRLCRVNCACRVETRRTA